MYLVYFHCRSVALPSLVLLNNLFIVQFPRPNGWRNVGADEGYVGKGDWARFGLGVR